MSDWTCDCGDRKCEQCGDSWAKIEPKEEIIKDYGDVRLLSDGTYEIDF